MAEAEAKEAERIASDVFKRGTLFVQIKLLLWKNLKLKVKSDLIA